MNVNLNEKIIDSQRMIFGERRFAKIIKGTGYYQKRVSAMKPDDNASLEDLEEVLKTIFHNFGAISFAGIRFELINLLVVETGNISLGLLELFDNLFPRGSWISRYELARLTIDKRRLKH